MKQESSISPDRSAALTKALKKIATADAVSSRAAIEAAKSTKPSLHARFVYDPSKAQA